MVFIVRYVENRKWRTNWVAHGEPKNLLENVVSKLEVGIVEGEHDDVVNHFE